MYPNGATLPCRCASRAALVAAVAALSMAACEGGGAVAAPRSSVATVSVSPTPTMMRVADTSDATSTTSMPSVAVGGSMSSMAEEISAVVRGVFAVRDAAAVGPTFDPDSAALALYASGDALGELSASIADKRDRGVGRRPSVVQLAVVTRCATWSLRGLRRPMGGSRRSGCYRSRLRLVTAGSARNFRRPVAEAKAALCTDHHRGRRPAVWSPGDAPVIDWGEIGPLFVFCAVLA